MMKIAAVIAGLACAVTAGAAFAANPNPQPVVVTNGPSAPVPVSGSVGVSGTVGVSNTQAAPLFVTSSPGVTSLAASASVMNDGTGTITTPAVPVSKCAQIRLGIITQNDGETFVVTVFNDLNVQLDQFIVGTRLGGNTINTSRVYDTPGLSIYMWLTPQNLPTGVPATWAVYCR